MKLAASLFAIVLTLGVVGLAIANEPLTVENRVATLEALHGIDRSTPTESPTSTATVESTAAPTNTPDPTATSVATSTAVPTATNEPQVCAVPAGAGTWHAPTDHEHGDAPPAWANDWSCAEFGWPVIFGGDEQTPNEYLNKERAFKGWSFSKDGVQIYIRLHFQSNPMGRSACHWHSYEVYAKDAIGAVSFWQGHVDLGCPPEDRINGGGTTAANIAANAGKQHFIVGAASLGEHEIWYVGQKFDAASWSWDFVWEINNPSTLYNVGEEADPANQATWEATGNYGTSRRLVHALYYIDGDAESRYPWRNNPGIRGWFCATPQGVITSQGSKTCNAGSIPQYVAVTMPALEGTTNVSRIYSSTGLTLPN